MRAAGLTLVQGCPQKSPRWPAVCEGRRLFKAQASLHPFGGSPPSPDVSDLAAKSSKRPAGEVQQSRALSPAAAFRNSRERMRARNQNHTVTSPLKPSE
eukprot:584417-Pelagomonas_calceolata.AAC.2